jgi:DNA-3-methyladenine glycosylase II
MTTTCLPDSPATVTTVDWPVRGRFDLAQSIGFGFGHTTPGDGDVLRLAFVVDGYGEQAGVAVTQPTPDVVRFDVTGDTDPERAAAQAARILSLDEDATGYDQMVDHDVFLSRAYAVRPGLRPPLFSSAYEGLAWGVLSARRPIAQMREVRDRLARRHGRPFEVAGEAVAAFPTPRRLLELREVDGVPEIKLRRMQAIAEAARDGELDTETLRNRDPDVVRTELQRFPGIGPFYAELVTVRTLGHTDVLPAGEPRVVAGTGALLGRDDLTQTDFEDVAEAWRPWRTWACVAIRASAASTASTTSSAAVRRVRPRG